MLHNCANSPCSNLFRRLNEGKLFQVEAQYLSAPRSSTVCRGAASRYAK